MSTVTVARNGATLPAWLACFSGVAMSVSNDPTKRTDTISTLYIVTNLPPTPHPFHCVTRGVRRTRTWKRPSKSFRCLNLICILTRWILFSPSKSQYNILYLCPSTTFPTIYLYKPWTILCIYTSSCMDTDGSYGEFRQYNIFRLFIWSLCLIRRL